MAIGVASIKVLIILTNNFFIIDAPLATIATMECKN